MEIAKDTTTETEASAEVAKTAIATAKLNEDSLDRLEGKGKQGGMLRLVLANND